jgi:hypothetical protein
MMGMRRLVDEKHTLLFLFFLLFLLLTLSWINCVLISGLSS